MPFWIVPLYNARLASLANAFDLCIDFCVFILDCGVARDFGAGVRNAVDLSATACSGSAIRQSTCADGAGAS
jgi:hypothetical protein